MNLWASQQAFQWHKFVFVVMSSLTVSYGIMMVWHGAWLVHQIARWWFMIMCRLAMYKPAWRGLWEETHRSQLPGRCSPVIIYAVRVLHGIQYVDMQLMSEALWCSTGGHSRCLSCDHVLTCPVKARKSMDPVLIQNSLRTPVMLSLTKVRQKGSHIQAIPVQNQLSWLNLWIQVKNRYMLQGTYIYLQDVFYRG